MKAWKKEEKVRKETKEEEEEEEEEGRNSITSPAGVSRTPLSASFNVFFFNEFFL